MLKDGTVDETVGPENDYDNYTAPDMNRLLYVYGEIAKLAGDRPFYIITIPSEKDFNFARENGIDFKLIESLQTFAEQTDNVEIIDLLPYFIAYADAAGGQYGDFTHSCDYHWSATGNRVTAHALLERIYGLASK